MAKNDAIMVIAVGAAAILGLSYLKEKYGGTADTATNAAGAYTQAKEGITNIITAPAGTGQAVAESLFGAGVNAADWWLKYQQGFSEGMVNVAQDTATSVFDKFKGEFMDIRKTVQKLGNNSKSTGSGSVDYSYEALKAKSDAIQDKYPTGSLAGLQVASGMQISDMMYKVIGGSSASTLVSANSGKSSDGTGRTKRGIRYNTKVKELL